MPMDKRRYPTNWTEISKARREQAGQRCEWCGLSNYSLVYTYPDGRRVEVTGHEADALTDDGVKLTRIVLTVAHLGTPHADGRPGDKSDKMDVRPENLAALCQRCHLTYDRDEHRATRARNKQAAIQQTGQQSIEVQP